MMFHPKGGFAAAALKACPLRDLERWLIEDMIRRRHEEDMWSAGLEISMEITTGMSEPRDITLMALFEICREGRPQWD
jgi:hypothetical protein